ncbi:MAG: GNAT family N-acetyltransferase [Nocardioidaceae bacterium]
MTDSTSCRVTANLRLRAVTLDDLPIVMAIETDPKTNKHRPGGPPAPEDVKQHLRAFVQTWDEHGVGYWIAEHQGEAVGLAGLRPLGFRGRPCWNVYYRFSPTVWRRGFATEAAREALAVARTREPLLPVVARTRPSNQPAVRVAERAGLKRRPDLDADGFLVLCDGW